ncbi:MAG: hypothetical protein H7Z13_03760 [Ferruginibacter sp.]|nr:hypothetical protein [Ferruginibacter sp.]
MLKTFSDIEKKWPDIFSKKNVIIGLLLFGLLLFRKSLVSLYNEKVISTLWSKAEPAVAADIVFFLGSIWLIIYFVAACLRQRQVSVTVTACCLLLMVSYIYYRFFSADYNFTPLYIIRSVKYADIFLLFVTGYLVLKASSLFKPKKIITSPAEKFYEDIPIDDPSVDLYGRKGYAATIAKKMENNMEASAASIAIGINGPWGSGKTSFINLIRKNLDGENNIFVDFNPWQSRSPERIVEDFFKVLRAALAPYHPAVNNIIANYSDQLLKIEQNLFTKLIKEVSDIFFGSNDVATNKENISRAIASIQKPVIIVIDDLDRLDKKEVWEVLRLIRNNADFKQVIYIVAYDKNYIIEAIREINSFNHTAYLEKIFQIEFLLPIFEYKKLRQEIKKRLKERLPCFAVVLDGVVDTNYYYINFTDRIIKTQRDAIRFINGLLIEVEPVASEIDFEDFYLLQLLKTKYPVVYDALFRYRDIFLKISERELPVSKTYVLRHFSSKYLDLGNDYDPGQNQVLKEMLGIDIGVMRQKEIDLPSQFILKIFLSENSALGLSGDEQDVIIFLVSYILREKYTEGQNPLAMRFVNNFDKYFVFSKPGPEANPA